MVMARSREYTMGLMVCVSEQNVLWSGSDKKIG